MVIPSNPHLLSRKVLAFVDRCSINGYCPVLVYLAFKVQDSYIFKNIFNFPKVKFSPLYINLTFRCFCFHFLKFFLKKIGNKLQIRSAPYLISYYLSISLSFFKILFLKLKIFLEDTCCSFAKSRMVIFLKYKESITFSSSSFSFRSA